jgi:hypothetical protein
MFHCSCLWQKLTRVRVEGGGRGTRGRGSVANSPLLISALFIVRSEVLTTVKSRCCSSGF